MNKKSMEELVKNDMKSLVKIAESLNRDDNTTNHVNEIYQNLSNCQDSDDQIYLVADVEKFEMNLSPAQIKYKKFPTEYTYIEKILDNDRFILVVKQEDDDHYYIDVFSNFKPEDRLRMSDGTILNSSPTMIRIHVSYDETIPHKFKCVYDSMQEVDDAIISDVVLIAIVSNLMKEEENKKKQDLTDVIKRFEKELNDMGIILDFNLMSDGIHKDKKSDVKSNDTFFLHPGTDIIH